MNTPNKPIKTSNQKMMPYEALKILYEGVSCKGKTNQEQAKISLGSYRSFLMNRTVNLIESFFIHSIHNP